MDGEVSGSRMSLNKKNKLLEFALSRLPKNNIKIICKKTIVNVVKVIYRICPWESKATLIN